MRAVPRVSGALMVALAMVVAAVAAWLIQAGAHPPAERVPLARAERVAPRSGADARVELELEGRIERLSVAPDGRVWLASYMGNTYTADRIDGDWRYGPIQNRDTTGLDLGPPLEAVSFFTPDTAFIWGHIVGGEQFDEGSVYRTTDGGATWDTVPAGNTGWIQDAFVLPSGEAWMGGSSGNVLYSLDYGATWRERAKLFDQHVMGLYFDGAGNGVAGSLGNALKLTRDGGTTWRALPTPQDQRRYARPHGSGEKDRIERVALFGGFVLAAQGGDVFGTRAERTDWKPLPGGPHPLFAVDRERGRVVAVTRAGRVEWFDSTLRPVRAAPGVLRAPAQDLVARGGQAYVLDVHSALYQSDGRSWTRSFPLTSAHPLRRLSHVREHAGRLWGVSRHHIYTSEDEGRGWTRRGDTGFPIRDFAIRDSTRILLWDGHGSNAEFDLRSGVLAPVAALNGDDVVEIVRRGDLWVAYGGKQYESAGRVEVSRTFGPGEFAGTRDYGFVYVSRDRGASWERADRWAAGGVAQLFLHPDGGMVLFSYLGSVRSVARVGGTYVPRDLLRAGPTTWNRVPYVETALGAWFPDRLNGYVSGNIHNVGFKAYRTRDGGRSWVEVSRAEFPYVQVLPAGNGYVASTPTRVDLLRGKEHETVYGPARWPQEQWEWPVTEAILGDSSVLVATSKDGLVELSSRRGWTRRLPTTVRVSPRSMH